MKTMHRHSETMPRHPGWRDYALLIILAMIWGSSFMFTKLAVSTISPITLTAARLCFAAIVLVLVTLYTRQALPRNLSAWGWIILAALFGNAIPFTLISWGQQTIDAGLAAILMGGMPLITILLAHIVTDDEKITVPKLVGVGCGIAGLMLLIGPSSLLTLGEETIRQLAVICAATCYAIAALITKRLTGLPRFGTIAAILLVSAGLMLLLSIFYDAPMTLTPTPTAVISTILLGVLHTAFATLLMFTIVARQGASFFGQINFLVPLFGVAWGVIFLSERPQQVQLIAMAIILTGVIVSRGVSRRGG